jgi:enamine deaminase RidA (YjgF/YER057c/UK114 family)
MKRISPGPRLSKAVVANGFVFISGLTAREKVADVATQTSDILAQIDQYLAEAGTDKSRLVNANIWLVDISTFSAMNGAWDAWVDKANLPARATVEAGLAGSGNLVEISAVALLPGIK